MDFDRIAAEYEIESVEFRFTDAAGHWRALTHPIADLAAGLHREVTGFRANSSSGFEDLSEIEPLLAPDFGATFVDPFAQTPTLAVVCNVLDPVTRHWSPTDPRSVAQRIESFIQSTHIGGSPRFSIEIAGVRTGGGDPRRLVAALETIGVMIKDPDALANGEPADLTVDADSASRAADRLMFCRYLIDGCCSWDGGASRSSKRGSAFDHVRVSARQSVWRNGRPLFAGDGYGGTSAIMRHYAAGLVQHTTALLELVGVPRFARPTASAGAAKGEFVASNHVSLSLHDPKAMSVTFAFPGFPPNPYLALAGLVLAGIDGFNYRMYNLDPDRPLQEFFKRQSCVTPSATGEREFLFTGGLFTEELLDAASAVPLGHDER